MSVLNLKENYGSFILQNDSEKSYGVIIHRFHILPCVVKLFVGFLTDSNL